MLKPTASIVVRPPSSGSAAEFSVETRWVTTDPNVVLDRPDGVSYGFLKKPAHVSLANRLIKAINAGVAFPNPTVAVDINGRTYVAHGLAIAGRHMNKNLQRLGY